MQLTLKCKYESGSVGFAATRVEGLPVPARSYTIAGSQVVLSGYDDAVLHHDIAELLAMPGGLYRLLTPLEQEAMAKAEFAVNVLQEGAEQGEQAPPTEPPAQLEPSGKKKNGGG